MENLFFFDGVCGLCNRNVDFIIRNDKNKNFKFIALQDAKALKILIEGGQPAPDFSSSILLHNGKFLYKSDVYLEIWKSLGTPWSIFYAFKIIPKFLRDWVYSIVAKNRYKIFGTLEKCRMPTAGEMDRFL